MQMKVKMKFVALVVSAGVALPGLVNAAQVAGDALDIYGKAHITLDSTSAKNDSGSSISNRSLSSNSSRLGFKGQAPVGSVTGFYKIEGSLSFENSGGAIDHRAAYVGLKGGMGSVLAGYRDTAFKDVRGMFDVFGDTVGDARNIIGSVNASNLFDKRAKNALMLTSPKVGGFVANVMYSTAWEGNTTAQQGQDNNNNSLTSINLQYKTNSLVLAAGWEEQKHVDATTGVTIDKGTGTRLVGAYDLGSMRIGLMYEKLDDDTNTAKRRSAYGINFVMNTGINGKIKLQYAKAGDTDASTASGANEIAVGYDHKLAKNSSTYIMYSKVSNDANASYAIGNGHDQQYITATGQDVSAVSVGYIYSF